MKDNIFFSRLSVPRFKKVLLDLAVTIIVILTCLLGCGEAGGGGHASDAKVIYKVATGEEADRPGFVKLTTSS